MKKLILLFVAVSISANLLGQDASFTQFNSVPTYLNPAFAGSLSQHRFATAYRNQWPGVKKSFTSYLVSYDQNVSKYNSGIGGYVLQDIAGTSNLSNTQVGLNYRYALTLNADFKLKLGLQAAFNQKKYATSKLVFNDQFITGAAVSQDVDATIPPAQFVDLGTGMLLESKLIWFGVSARHLNQPNESLIGGKQPLPMFISAHGGYKYEIERSDKIDDPSPHTIGVLFNFKHQGINDQLDFGVSYFYKVINFTLWYRGLPFKTYNSGYSNSESLAFLLSYEPLGKGYKVGYSYDLTISSLTAKNTLGAHEITLVYEFGKKAAVASRKYRKSIGGSMKF